VVRPDFPLGEAVISADRAYRYVLNRRWDYAGPIMAWVMLNPSTADADTDDQTIRRCTAIAAREGCRGICVVNLFALRATSPVVLRSHRDPAGPENDRWLEGLAAAPDGPVVVAWGAHAAEPWARPRRDKVLALLAGLPLACLGVTAAGEPRHPCRLAADTPLRPYAGLPGPPPVMIDGDDGRLS
jgi:hypothetical protein